MTSIRDILLRFLPRFSMTKLRPGRHCFLLQIESSILIESTSKDPLEALNDYLNNPASRPATITFSEATGNQIAKRRIKLLPFASEQQDSSQQESSNHWQREADPYQNKIICLDHHRRMRRGGRA